MIWNLWLDDERDPNLFLHSAVIKAGRMPEFLAYAQKGYQASDFQWAKSASEAKEMVLLNGPPAFIAFDHDLDPNENAVEFIRWLSNGHFDAEIDYLVHSSNPDGQKNIVSLMETWKNAREGF